MCHHLHNRSTPDYKEPRENLAVNGLSVMRGMCIGAVLVGWVLALQMGDTSVPVRGWWTQDALITVCVPLRRAVLCCAVSASNSVELCVAWWRQGLWCMIRLFGCLLVAASAYVFDAHALYRLVVSALTSYPPCALRVCVYLLM